MGKVGGLTCHTVCTVLNCLLSNWRFDNLNYLHSYFHESWLISNFHCVKSVRIRSYSGPHFPAFGLNMERYSVSLRIQSEYGKMRTRTTPNTDTFYAVFGLTMFCWHIEMEKLIKDIVSEIFRTPSNIYDRDFFAKIGVKYFWKKGPSYLWCLERS